MMSATAYKKGDAIYLHSHSKTTVGLRISTEPFISVAIDESPRAKGEAVLAVLNASLKTVVPHPKQDEWDGVFAPMLKLAGSRSLRAFEKDAVCCGLEVEESELSVIPCQKRGPNRNYEGLMTETVKLPFASSPEEIAVALEEGFLRCSPENKKYK